MKTAQIRRRLRLMVLTSLAILALLLPTVAFAAPVAPVVEAQSQWYGCSTWHTVRYGETLSEIARYYGVSQQAIMNENGIYNPSRILAGSRLCIPAGGGGGGGGSSWNQGSSCTAWHRVQYRDTLSGIAQWYGVSQSAIMQANNIWDPNHIWVGQKLCIPGGYNPSPGHVNPGHGHGTGCTGVHYVSQGETLNIIAAYYGTTTGHLMQLNGLPNPNHIWVGQRLVVPCGGYVPQPPCCQPPPPPCCQPVQPPCCQPPPPCCQPVHPVSGPWNAQFFNNRDLAGGPTFSATFDQIGFNWGYGGPGNGIGNDNFSARFTREQHLTAGTYRFYVTSDDGVRVFINDILVIDAWRIQSAQNYYIGDFNVGEGVARIRVEYFEAEGQAVLYASFSKL